MAEYIERDALLSEIQTMRNQHLLSKCDGAKVERMARQLPAADVAPVVHERCEFCRDGKTFIGAMAVGGNDGRFHKINYCLHCGAKMDLEELQ